MDRDELPTLNGGLIMTIWKALILLAVINLVAIIIECYRYKSRYYNFQPEYFIADKLTRFTLGIFFIDALVVVLTTLILLVKWLTLPTWF